jgi:hypothetical protein
VAGFDCSFWNAWLVLRVVRTRLSLREYLPSLPCPSLSLGSCTSKRELECLGLSLRVAEWEMMAMGWPRTGQASIKALVGVSCLHGRC